MKKIEILGTGCPKCKKLYERTKEVVGELGLDAEVVKVEDIQAIVAAGIMMTPGLMIDGEVKSAGKLLSVDELKKVLS